MYKILGNAMIGKFSQRSQRSEVISVNSKEQIESCLKNNEVLDVQDINDSVCELVVKSGRNSKNTMCRKTNCIIGAYVSALARVDIHKHICQLVESSCIPYYVDCDCIIFACKKKQAPPISPGLSVGQFKNELGEKTIIKDFFSLGRKNYSLTFEKDKKTHSLTKIRGLTLTSGFVKENFSHEDYVTFCKKAFQEENDSIKIPQERWRKNGRTKKVSAFTFTNKPSFQRVMINDLRMSTVPYGYKCS